MKQGKRLSFVIPVWNEAENIDPLVGEILEVCSSLKLRDIEIVLVSDGSTDGTEDVISDLTREHRSVRGILMRVHEGKATALMHGFNAVSGDVIVTLDGDGQDDPHELPKLLDMLTAGFDMVSGWKRNRKDSFVKNVSSALFNAVTRFFTKLNLHDYNCGFKAYRREAVKSLVLYGELHRYIPALLASKGYRVAEVRIEHRLRFGGRSKYGMMRFLHGYFDLYTVLLMTRFRARPLHLFGYIGLPFFGLGFTGGVYLTMLKITTGQSIGGRPLLLLSVLLMVIGVQITVTGLLGEHITYLMRHTQADGTNSVIRTVGFKEGRAGDGNGVHSV